MSIDLLKKRFDEQVVIIEKICNQNKPLRRRDKTPPLQLPDIQIPPHSPANKTPKRDAFSEYLKYLLGPTKSAKPSDQQHRATTRKVILTHALRTKLFFHNRNAKSLTRPVELSTIDTVSRTSKINIESKYTPLSRVASILNMSSMSRLESPQTSFIPKAWKNVAELPLVNSRVASHKRGKSMMVHPTSSDRYSPWESPPEAEQSLLNSYRSIH